MCVQRFFHLMSIDISKIVTCTELPKFNFGKYTTERQMIYFTTRVVVYRNTPSNLMCACCAYHKSKYSRMILQAPRNA